MLDWAVKHLTRWPSRFDFDYAIGDASPGDIAARFSHYEHKGSMMVLECRLSGFIVDSTDYFYRTRKPKNH
jgi:hypothetical protein